MCSTQVVFVKECSPEPLRQCEMIAEVRGGVLEQPSAGSIAL